MSSSSIGVFPERQIERSILECLGSHNELLSIVSKYLDEASSIQLARCNTQLAGVVAIETAFHSSQRIIAFVDDLIHELESLLPKSKELEEENANLEKLITEVKLHIDRVQTAEDLAICLRGLESRVDTLGLMCEIRAFIQSKSVEGIGVTDILTGLKEFLEAKLLSNQNEQKRGLELQAHIDELNDSKMLMPISFGSPDFLSLDFAYRKEIIQTIRNELVEAIKKWPQDLLKQISDKIYGDKFIDFATRGCAPDQSAQFKRAIKETGVKFSSLAQFKYAIDRLAQEIALLPDGVRLTTHLVRNEIAQFKDVKAFAIRKTSWLQNLIQVAQDEDQKKDLTALLNNGTIENSDQLLDAFMNSPVLLSFLADHLLRKFQVELQENAFLDLASIAAQSDLSFKNSFSVEAYKDRIGHIPSHLLAEKALKSSLFGLLMWEVLNALVRHLLSYDLPERAAEMLKYFGADNPLSREEKTALDLIVDYYLNRGDIQAAAALYSSHLRSTPNRPLTPDDIDRALAFGISLADLASWAIMGQNGFACNDAAILRIVDLWLHEEEVDKAKSLIAHAKFDAKSIHTKLSRYYAKKGQKELSLFHTLEAFTLIKRPKEKEAMASELSQNSVLCAALIQSDALSIPDKVQLEFAMANRKREEGDRDQALAHYRRALGMIAPQHLNQLKRIAKRLVITLAELKESKEAFDWIAGLEASNAKDKFCAHLSRALSKIEGCEEEALKCAEAITKGSTNRDSCLARLIPLFIPVSMERAIEIAKMCIFGMREFMQHFKNFVQKGDLKIALKMVPHLFPKITQETCEEIGQKDPQEVESFLSQLLIGGSASGPASTSS